MTTHIYILLKSYSYLHHSKKQQKDLNVSFDLNTFAHILGHISSPPAKDHPAILYPDAVVLRYIEHVAEHHLSGESTQSKGPCESTFHTFFCNLDLLKLNSYCILIIIIILYLAVNVQQNRPYQCGIYYFSQSKLNTTKTNSLSHLPLKQLKIVYNN